jgi:autotransporter-associated beta strand protein
MMKLLKVCTLLSSLCCYSQLVAANATVTTTADSGAGSLRAAITTANAGGGLITMGIAAGSTITLLSDLPSLQAAITLNNTSVPINIAGNGHRVFVAESGVIVINNIDITGANATGGAGGSNPTDGLHGGGGGGGGLGAGSGLFVNAGATVIITDVTFSGNTAVGGAGGNGGNCQIVGNDSGGGGGGGFYSAGAGGIGGAITNPTNLAGTGGGGGGGVGSGMPGLTEAGISMGGAGGVGAGPGGAGGAGGVSSNGSSGVAGGGPFLGGGGGGGAGGLFRGGSGGDGGDFAGGGGTGGNSTLSTGPVSVGGSGGFGGGGGGGGGGVTINLDARGSHGGGGGFGAGGGGSGTDTSSSKGVSVFGGGSGGLGSGLLTGGGGGGAAMGGAIFVRQGGVLTINYGAAGSSTPIISNTVQGGAAGNNGALAGGDYGPDLFLASGGTLTFQVDRPVTLSSILASDTLATGSGITVQGTGVLTLTGANTYSGTTTVNAGGTLAIQNNGNLGTSIGGVLLDNGTLQVLGSFTLPRTFTLNAGNGTVDVSSVSDTLQLSGVLSGTGRLFATGTGTLNLANVGNSYSGGTTITTGTVQISAPGNLGNPAGGLTIANGTLQLLPTFGTNTLTENILLNAPGGTIQADAPVIGTLSGLISGAGRLFATGTGTLNLANVGNSYSGGTTITTGTVQISAPGGLGNPVGSLTIANGTLQLLSAFGTNTLTENILLNAPGGTIQADAPVIGTLSGIISGGGALSIAGGGIVILSGNNTYGGGTNIALGSTLEVQNFNSLPSSGSILDNGLLVFNNATNTASPGPISGSGSVTMQGAGTLALLQPNTYSGGTIVTAGVVQISNPSSLGSGTLSLGSTLEILPSFQTNVLLSPIVLTAPGGTIQTDPGTQLSYFGSITGVGPLSKTGSGTLALLGASNFTGGTTISAGTVRLVGGSLTGAVNVGPAGLLSGAGTVGSVVNDGTVMPIGFLNVTGSYVQNAGGTFIASISGTGPIHRLVAGTATLDGTLNVSAIHGAYVAGQQYTILSAAGGVAPAFSTVNLPSFLKVTVTYEPDAVLLTINEQSILPLSKVKHYNPNQVLNYIRKIEHDPNSDLIQLIDSLGLLNTDQLTNALDQLHPAPFGAFDLLNASTSSQIASIFNRRVGSSCCIHQAEPKSEPEQYCGCENTNAWIQPFGNTYSQDKMGEQVGFSAFTRGVLAGAGYRFSSHLRLGIGGGYSSSRIHWDKHRGHGATDAGYFGAYADYSRKLYYIEASVVGSIDKFFGARHIDFTTVNRHARHRSGGSNFTAHLGGGSDIDLSKCYLSPFMTVDYFHLYQKSFREHGAGDLNLAVQSRHSKILRSEIGLSVTESYAIGDQNCWSPTIWLSGISEVYLSKRLYHARFTTESFGFKARTYHKPLYLIAPGIDLSFLLKKKFSFSFRYSAELSRYVANQKADAKLEWIF